ncbi:MAG: hypothetical protein MK165_03140 [Pirellulaceae bacterium]|nr:hypothetical protein [Pirellulaceae bacterium]
MRRGTLAILAMILVGVALSGYAVWHHHRLGRRVLTHWGATVAERIQHAPQVELIEFLPALSLERLAAEGGDRAARSPAEVRVRDISEIPGLIHARVVLIRDASFEWEETDHVSGTPTFGLRFSAATEVATGSATGAVAGVAGAAATTLEIDPQARTITCDGGRPARLTVAAAASLTAFFAPHLAPEEPVAGD